MFTPYAKAIVSALINGLAVLQVVSTNTITLRDWVTIALTVLTSFALVWAVPFSPKGGTLVWTPTTTPPTLPPPVSTPVTGPVRGPASPPIPSNLTVTPMPSAQPTDVT